MFENVVAGVLTGMLDDQVGRDVIALAQELVAPGGRLTLVHVHLVTPKPAPDSGAGADAAHCRQALERLTALADELPVHAEVRCVETRSARRGLHEFASVHQADLLVVGASRGDENDRTLVGDDTRKVLEDAPCAVAVAPAGYSTRAAGIKKIGIAFDGSAESERALELGRRLAAERLAELSAIEVVQTPLHDPANVRGEIEEDVEAARQRLAAVADVDPHAAYGDSVEELARYGDAVDLLVIGSHKYRPIDRLAESTTSQRLADEASSPLLVLPRAGRAGG